MCGEDTSSRWTGTSLWSLALGKQGGVAVLINANSDINVLSWLKDTCGRVLSLLLKIGTVRVNVINIYAPAALTERKIFFEGDYNCYDSELDKFGGNASLAKYLAYFKTSLRLVDIWRKSHPRSREMSWFNADYSIGSRLDRFCISPGLVKLSEKCEISPCCVSDHDFVSLCLDFNALAPRGPGMQF